MKILLLTRYNRNAASSRYRSYQFLPFLSKTGIEVDTHPLLGDSYLQNLYSGRSFSLFEIVQCYFKRMIFLLNKNRYDLLWIEAEAFPWIPFWFEKILLGKKIPYIVDYDDAAFHRYDQHQRWIVRWFLGKKIDQVMNQAAIVIAGNEYIAQKAKKEGARRVEMIPTVVDLSRYPYKKEFQKNEIVTIGWIGTPWTSKYLDGIQSTLIGLCEKRKAKIILVGAAEGRFVSEYIQVKPWSELTEVDEIQKFDIGIMPLSDSLWERGKCGLKLIQYMACGRPIVGTPVGVNKEIILDGINGFQVSTPEDWIRALQVLIENEDLRNKMGQAGRQMVEEKYSVQVTLPKLLDILTGAKN